MEGSGWKAAIEGNGGRQLGKALEEGSYLTIGHKWSISAKVECTGLKCDKCGSI